MISSKLITDLIKELNETDETEHLEAKEISGNSVDTGFYETVCALSNEPDLGGGTIVLGVEKEIALFPLYNASGVMDSDKISSDISSACSTMFNIPVRVDINVEKVDGKSVIKVDVPELARHQKPVYFKKRGLPSGAFRRIGPTDIRCTDEDLIAFFQGKAHDPHDVQIIEDASWDDIDARAIEAYRRARRETNPLAEELNWSDEEILHALGAIRYVGGNIKITNTGLITFGRSHSLRRLAPTQRVDYIRVPGIAWIPDPQSSFESIDMRGPALMLVGRIIAAIVDDLPKGFGIDDKSGQRTEMPLIPTRVIREAVVNCLMHRSYQVFQPVQIIRYANRLVIKNPGYSLKSQDRFDEPGSAIRNPHIAEILHETRFAETKGSGIRVMRQRMAQTGLTPPTFDSNRDNDEFTAIFLFHHFLNEADWDWLGQFKGLELTEDQMRALIFLREVGAIDNSAYRSLTQTDTLTASRSLRRLRTLDLIADRGSGSRTHYVPGPALIASETKPANMDASIHAKGSAIYGRSGDRLAGLPDLPIELRARVQAVGKRLEPKNTEALIIDLCKWRPLSAEEVANLLGKTSAYISQRFLYPMVREKKLGYLYPEMVKHPGQKYLISD